MKRLILAVAAVAALAMAAPAAVHAEHRDRDRDRGDHRGDIHLGRWDWDGLVEPGGCLSPIQNDGNGPYCTAADGHLHRVVWPR